MNPSVAFGRVLVDELVRGGLRHACLAPGSRSAPVALALAEDDRIDLHVAIDERSAAFLALGMARATRSPAAVLTTSGSAAANLHPAIVEADEGRVPLVALTADRPPELRQTGANQTTDQLKLFGDAVRWFCEVGVPDPLPSANAQWRSTGSRALAEAAGSPPGPVHLNLSLREPLVPPAADEVFPHDLSGRPGYRPWTDISRAPARASEHELEALAADIARSERGLLLCGACDVDPEPLLDLARVAGWPVLAEPASGLRCTELAISTYEALLRHEPFSSAHAPDLVLRVGKLGLSRAVSAFVRRARRHVLLDADAAWLDPERVVDRLVVAEPASAAAEIVKAVPERRASSWLESWQNAERNARGAVDDLLDAEPAPNEPRAARDVAAALPDGSSLVAAASMPVRDVDSFMAPRRGLRVFGNRGANGIDGFVSTALGIAAASASDGPTCALAGDLSLLHDQNGFLSTAAGSADCVFVVLNNDGGGIFSFLEQAAQPEHFETLFGTPHGLDLERFAALYGHTYARAMQATDLVPLLDAAIASGGVHVIEVPTERAANVDLHRRLWAAVAGALG